jgi:hypothetical protein
VTYQIDQIQSMISEVDRVLRQTRSRKFWTIFTNHTLQRQALERCRNFLVMQQRPTPPAASTRTDLQLIPNTNPVSVGMAEANLALELQRLRQEVMHPLRSDVAALGNQRTALQEEIQALMFQKAQLLADCETVRLNLTTTASTPSQKSPAHSSSLDETELARLQALRDRTDFLLTSMDSSLQLAFGSMQKNVEVYTTTLHTGLDRMHHLGYQGEVLFSTLVNRLAQQVGRDMAIALPERSLDRETDPIPSRTSTRIEPTQPSAAPSRSEATPAPQFLEETSAQTATQSWAESWADRPDVTKDGSTNASMNESIDFFFADFDETLPAKSHQNQQSSSLNLIPQQVDSINGPLSLEVESIDMDPDQPISDDSLTIDGLFGGLEEPSPQFVESEMTLAEMDDLFADVPSL